MSDNASSIISKYINPDSNLLKKHGNAGSLDGSKEIPASNIAGYSTYEQSLINDFQGAWNKYLEVKGSDIASKTQKLEANKQEINETIMAQQEQFEQQKTAAFENLLKTSGPNSADRESLRKDFESTQRTFNELRTLLSRPVEVNYTKIYLVLLIGLSFAELGINRIAFTYHFGDGTMATVVALAVGVIFLFFAHTTGKIIKESTCLERNPNKAQSYSACLIIGGIMLVLMYFIAIIREKLARGESSEQLDFQALTGQPVMMTDFFGTTLGEEGTFMMLLNISVFAVGVSASFFRHDSHPSYEKSEKLLNGITKKLEQHIKDHETSGIKINEEYGKKINFQNSLANQKESEIKGILKDLELAEDDKQSVRESLANSLLQMLLSYYRGNESKRTGPVPEHFSTQKPEKLIELFN
jgi:hypothetical protein